MKKLLAKFLFKIFRKYIAVSSYKSHVKLAVIFRMRIFDVCVSEIEITHKEMVEREFI